MKKKTFAKIFSAFLAVVMVLCSAPLSGFTGIVASAETLSGTCGDNVSWSLDTETGELNITGFGAMYDYGYWSDYGYAPWYSQRSLITSVNIGDGITTIGKYAFYYCENMQTVKMTSSVKEIESDAFNSAYGLKYILFSGTQEDFNSITIGSYNSKFTSASLCLNATDIAVTESGFEFAYGEDSATLISYKGTDKEVNIPSEYEGKPVVAIGGNAFYDRNGLTSIIIPDSVTSIGNYAFYNCYNLTSIEIPDGVTNIGNSAFYRCYNLTSITIPDNVTSIGSYAFAACGGLTSITIPDGVTSISDHAFDGCYGLTSITIPDSVTSIGESAFADCDELTSITIPDSVTSIGASVFDGCSSLVSITIPDSVTSINDYAFSNCSSLTSITIPDSVTSIGNRAFYYCTSLESVTIPDGVTSITDYMFGYCSNLVSVTIPDSVTSIGNNAFCDCASLASITVPDSVTSIGKNVFYNCKSLKSITIPDGVTSISDYMFGNCSNLVSVTIPDSVTSIGNSAFYNCKSLASITVPDSVDFIGDDAFYGTPYYNNSENWDNGILYLDDHLIATDSSVTGEVVIREGTKTIAPYTFYSDCDNMTSVIIPDSVTKIGEYAFYGLSGLTSAVIPASITEMSTAFMYCSNLKTVAYSGSEEDWQKLSISSLSALKTATILYNTDSINATEEGFIFGVSGEGFSLVDYVGTETKVVIPAEYEGKPVVEIGSKAFKDNKAITSVTIPDSVTSIGDYVFHSCEALTSVTIPDSVTNIGDYAFTYCTSLDKAEISDNLVNIGTSVFYGCTALKEVTIPDSVTIIGVYAFKNCTSLTSVTFSDNTTSIGYAAFEQCTSLTSITVPDGVTSIEMDAFYGCTSLAEIELPDTLISVGSDAFYNTAFYNNTENWENGVLYISNCLYATDSTVSGEYVIKDGTRIISSDTFKNCSNLTSVKIPDTVTEIGSYAFYNCDGLTSVEIPGSVITVGNCAFSSCDSLTSVVIGEGVTTVGEDTFFGCKALVSAVLPKSMKTAYYAFTGCSNLKIVAYSGTAEEWSDLYFGWASYLNDVTVIYNSDSIISSDSGLIFGKNEKGLTLAAYTGDDTEVVIPSEYDGMSVVAIGKAFEGVSTITSVTIPDSVTSIAADAFYGTALYDNAENWEDNALYIDNCLIKVKSGTGNFTVKEGTKVIADNALASCSGFYSVSIPDSVLYIGNSAFEGCSKLAVVNMSSNVKEIGDSAFSNCSNLYVVSYNGTEEDFEKIVIGDDNDVLTTTWALGDESAYSVTDNGLIYMSKDNIVTICGYTGTDTDLVIPAEIDGMTVKGVLARTFSLSGVSTVTIPATVEKIDFAQDYMVPQNDNFKEFIVDEGNGHYSSVDGVLFSKDKTELVYYPHGKSGDSYAIPEGTVKLGELAFSSNYYIKTLTIPASVIEIDHGKKNNHAGVGGFSGALEYIRSLENFVVDENNPNYSNDDNGVLYNKDKTELISYPSGKTDSEYVVPSHVKKIGDVAFARANNLEIVEIPEGVTYFGGFYCCTNLVGVMIPEGITTIPKNAFYGCTMLYSVVIPGSVTTIEENAFYMAGAFIILFGGEKLQFVYSGTEEDWNKVNIIGLDNQEMFAYFIDITFLGPACEHEYTSSVTKEPTCAEAGETTYTCSLCEKTYTETIAKLAHTSGEAVKENEKEATCTTAASYDSVVYCTVCSVEISRETVETSSALGHTEGEAVIENEVAATPATEGSYDTVIYCTVCNAELSRETTVVPALGHTSGEAVIENEVPATCTSEGSYDVVTYCTCCTPAVELTRETVSVPTVSHTEVTEITEPTCTETGKTVVACSVCGEIISETEISALGHAEGKAVEENRTEATCTTAGSYDTVVNCSVCGEELSRETKSIPVLGHRFGAWQVTTEPTMTENGIKTRTCSVCEKTEESTVPATGVTAKLIDSQGNVVKEMVFESAGVSSVSMGGIDNGTYTLVISQESYVTRTYTVVAINGIVNAEFKLNKQGDINGDGRVNTVDVARANAHAKGTSSLSGYEFACVDINGDGRVNTIDVAQMNAHTKGVSTLW